MCGIAGFLGSDHSAEALAARMASALHHRGPDDGGVAAITHVSGAPAGALSARRLAIRDTSDAGHQPMVSRDGRFTLVYNGELYNADELRTDLEKRGAAFRGHSDTEVLLHAWADEGAAVLPKLRGMFAFCIWDATAGRAFLCRDRFGIKPLYISPGRDCVLFASELRALLTTDRVNRTLDDNALAGYLGTGAVPEPRTLLRDVFMLPAGSFIEVDAALELSLPNPFAIGSLLPATPGGADFGAAARAVHDALADSVQRHLVSDVPLGVFLSGGIDSVSLVALMAEQGTIPETFTVCFEQAQYDEAAIARTVAQRFGTKHHVIMLRGSDVLDKLPHFFDASDHPSADGLNTYCIAEAVHARDITVAISGLGGDELFAGYPSFKRARRIGHIPKHRGIIKRIAAHTPRTDETKRAQMSQMLAGGDPALASFLASRMLFTPQQIAQLMHSGERTPASLAGIPAGALDGPAYTGNRMLNRLSALELAYYTRNTLLRDADIFTMANSLELRVPFLDVDVARAAAGASDRCKLAGRRPKPLLLDALGDRIPAAVWRRPKQGFVLPLQHWMQHELRAEVMSSLSSRTLTGAGLRAPFIRDAWNAFERKPSSRTTTRVWALFALARWLERTGVTRA